MKFPLIYITISIIYDHHLCTNHNSLKKNVSTTIITTILTFPTYLDSFN